MNYLKVISIISVMSVQLLGKEFELHTESLENLKESIVKEINRDMIDSSSISFKSAKNSRDEINSLFESESSRYRNMLLKYSIDLSYLQKSKNEKKRDSEEASVLLKNKRAKKVQIESEIANEREYLQNLKKLLKSGIEFSSNISTEGYFVTIVEGKRSVKRDQLIEMATDSINREAIGTLNGILVETVSKFSKTLSMEIKETSSGKAISDS